MVKARIYIISLLDFINSISQTDDIQDVSARTVGRSDLLEAGGGATAPTPSPLATGLQLSMNLTDIKENASIATGNRIRYCSVSF